MKKLIIAGFILAVMGSIVVRAQVAVGRQSDKWKNKTFTLEELKQYDGKDGHKAYVAVDGIVYDLSSVAKWKGGFHMNMHHAGMDLTKEIKEKAPISIHGKGEILKKMPKVGVLAQEAAATNPEVKIYKPQGVDIGREKTCPVSKDKFKVTDQTQAVTYKGKTYFFCCPDCYGPFIKEPEKYIQPAANKKK